MIAVRKPLDGFAVAVMLALCLVWGLQPVAIKVATPAMAPVSQIILRSAIAALLLSIVTVWRGPRLSLRDGTLWPGIAAGILFAGEFWCGSTGLLHTSAAHISVFLYTAPIFTAIGLHLLLPSERLSPRQWLGVLVSFAGIALAFADGQGTVAGHPVTSHLGDALGILGGMCWAATTLVIRRSSLSEAPPVHTLLYQLAVCVPVLLLVAGFLGSPATAPMTPITWGSLIFQTVLVSFISFLTWFWMMRHYLTTQLSVFSFLTPLFGVGFGVLILHEPVGLRFLAGAVLVLLGIGLVTVRQR